MKFRLSIITVLSSVVAATRAASRARAEGNNDNGADKVPFRDPFVPRKLTPLNDDVDDPWDFAVDDDEGGLWLVPEDHPIHKEAPAVPLKNVAGSDNIFSSSNSASSSNQFDASEELGILNFDSVVVPNNNNYNSNNKIEIVSNQNRCTNYTMIPANATFSEIVQDCVTGTCTYDLPIGCWRTDQVTDMSYAFYDLTNFNDPDINYWNLGAVTTTKKMFFNAKSFNQDLNWNPLNLKDMTGMFYGATAFNRNIGDWNTEGVTSMKDTFRDAKAFNIDISNWKIQNLKDMTGMFYGATAFNGNISNWNTDGVTSMKDTFRDAKAFNIDISNWKTSSCNTMANMFRGAKSFNNVVKDWDTTNVTDMRGIFERASSFNEEINNWNTAKITSLSKSFYNASAFDRPLGNWLPDTSQVTDLTSVFQGALAFNQDIGTWQTRNVEKMNRAFSLTYNFNQPLNDWDVSSVTNMNRMFVGAFKFNQPFDDWNTSKVSNMSRMFAVTVNFNQPLDSWDTQSVTDMSRMFTRARLFNQDIGYWDTRNVKAMNDMFRQSYFNEDIGNWNTTSVTNMKKMFHYATYFNTPIFGWDTSAVKDMSYMFSNAARFNQRLHDWDTGSVTNMYHMFKDANNFLQCLNTWKDRTPPTAITTDIFEGSRCPYPDDVPDRWCQIDSECADFGTDTCEDFPVPWECEGVFSSCADGLEPDFDVNTCRNPYFGPNCPSICKDGCGICNNRPDSFTYQEPLNSEEQQTTCTEIASAMANWTEEQFEIVCRQPIVAFKCPAICSATCQCKNVDGEVEIVLGGSTTTCEAVALLPNVDRNRMCKEENVMDKCPGICKKDGCKCVDLPVEFVQENGQTTTCEEVAAKPINKRERLCTNRPTVKDSCPSVCREESTGCQCENFQGTFNLRNNESTSCKTVEAQKPKRRKRLCLNKKINANCPGVCNDTC